MGVGELLDGAGVAVVRAAGVLEGRIVRMTVGLTGAAKVGVAVDVGIGSVVAVEETVGGTIVAREQPTRRSETAQASASTIAAPIGQWSWLGCEKMVLIRSIPGGLEK